MYRRPSRIIVAQYEGPRGISLLAAAELLGEGKRAIAAQVVDLAVRRVISIGRPIGKGKRSGFTITIVGDPTAENPDEQAVLTALFDRHLPIAGESMVVRPGRNRGLGVLLQHPHRIAVARLITAGLAREKSLLIKVLQPWRKQPVVPTEMAFQIVDQLWGARDYMELAEKDRFAMLQSPEGAQRSPLGQLDILRLYERLLPYAVLFGLEKQWAAELDLRMRELPPDVLDALLEVADVANLVVSAADLVGSLPDLGDAPDLGDLPDLSGLSDVGDIVSASDSLEGVGAIFGGIAEFLGSLAP